jgi:hypothetical protein
MLKKHFKNLTIYDNIDIIKKIYKEVKMRSGNFVEKRRSKRLDLSLPANIRYASQDKEEALEGVTLNVSFNGAYVGNISLKNIQPNETVKICITVPRDETRDFPFSRIIGKARVVRIEKDGVAVDFDDDISRLFAASN